MRSRYCVVTPRRLEIRSGRDERPGQRLQERHELALLVRRQPDRLELAAAERRGRSSGVVRDHIRQRRELAGVHVRRSARDVAEGRRLVGAHELRTFRHREPQLLAILRLRVAVPTRAVELTGNRLAAADCATTVGRQHDARQRHTGVVEVVVGEQRPVVARDAARTSDEQAQASLLVTR